LLPWGRRPALPAFTPDYRQLVIPNEESDNVSILSLEDLTVVGTVALEPGSRPWQAKVLPAGGYAYVTNSRFGGTAADSPTEPSTVSVLDLEAGRVVHEIPVGAGPNGVTVDRAGRRGYVVNMRSGTISVIDAARHAVIDTLPVGRAPAFAKLTLDGKLLVVTNLRDASITVIDTARLAVVKTLVVGVPDLREPFPEWGPGDTTGVAITADYTAFVTNYRSHTIVEVDLSDFSTVTHESPIRFPFFVEIDREEDVVLFSSGVEKSFCLWDRAARRWLGTYPNNGTALPEAGMSMNLWMTDPDNHRITALLPRGLRGISDWKRNIVTKFL
jgi:YVTN family beta-propeller protein